MQELQNWAVNVNHTRVTELLHILSPYHPELPLDCRTLLKTPKSATTQKLETGELIYFGLLESLKQSLKTLPPFTLDELQISFNVDGIPLYRSSSIQLWPILGQIKNVNSSPFVVTMFCGTSKPSPLSAYLADFVKELKELLEHGYEKKHYIIKIHSIICDAPARSFLKCIKSHAGYSSCEKCTVTGRYVLGRVILNSISEPRRSDESFLRQLDKDHHLTISPLTELPIGLVTNFPLDYMHCVCLGVMRKLLNVWISGPLQVRLGFQKIKQISAVLESWKPFIPVEFNRKCRSLSEISRWKATEFRLFLLYLGPIVLKNVVDLAVYEHFLLFHTGIAILISNKHLSNYGTDFAGELLNVFVSHSEVIYGSQFCIYNVHILCHLSDDVKTYGALHNFSAFPFENYLGIIKRLVRSTRDPLREIYSRIHEINFTHAHNNKKKVRLWNTLMVLH
jgi:hypothetical protein